MEKRKKRAASWHAGSFFCFHGFAQHPPHMLRQHGDAFQVGGFPLFRVHRQAEQALDFRQTAAEPGALDGAADRLFHAPGAVPKRCAKSGYSFFPCTSPGAQAPSNPVSTWSTSATSGHRAAISRKAPSPSPLPTTMKRASEHPFNAVRFGGRDIHTAQHGFFFRDVKEENSTDVMVTARAMPQMARMVMTPVLTALAYWPSTT